MKIILTESQVKRIVNELSLEGIVDEFIQYVKDKHLFGKVREMYPYIKKFSDFEEELSYMDYDDFIKLRDFVTGKEF